MSNTTQGVAPGVEPPLTTNTMLSISDLVRLLTKDRKTITKRVQAGRYPNAVQDDTGLKAWWVPVKDLVTVGDLDSADVVEVTAALESARETKLVRELRARVGELESALAGQTARAEERHALITTLQAVIAGLLPPSAGAGVAS